MAYQKQTWVDGVTLLDAEHLNHMEQGISQLSEEIVAARDYYFLKSPNGTIYKITVSDTGILQAVGESDVNLPDLIPGRLLVWNDEFDGDTVDLDKWYFRTFGFDGIYGTDGATVHDGMLDLCLVKGSDGNITKSTMMMTNGRAEFRYGRIEAKMKFDINCHAAFWCVGQLMTQYNGEIQGVTWPYAGEIDIFEPINNNSVYSTLHWGSEDGSVHDSQRAGTLVVDYTEWHTYAVEWTETTMTFYCDNSVIGTVYNIGELTNPDGFKPFNEPFYIILQMMHNSKTTEGEYHAYVDWVRYYAPESVSSLIDMQTLALSETGMSLNPNRVKELELTITPDYVTDYTLVWASDNIEVATFTGGNRVTAVGNGTANLTVTAKNGVIAKCVLTVSDDAYNPVTGITISGADKTNYFTGESVQLSATISPKWATHLDVLWESSDGTVATVTENGLVEFISNGTVKITAKAADDSGTSSYVEFTVKADFVDNIQTVNCTAKMTRAGWGAAEWKSDIPADTSFDATSNKMTYVSGSGYYFDVNFGKGLSFVQQFGFNSAYTMAARIKLPANVELKNETRIMSLSKKDAASSSTNPRMYLGAFTTGKYVLRAYDADGNAAINKYNATGLFTPSETEQSLNIIYAHGEDGTYKLYVNGTVVVSGTDSVQMPSDNVVAFLGGFGGMDNDMIFQAYLVYAENLSDDKIAALNAALDEMFAF